MGKRELENKNVSLFNLDKVSLERNGTTIVGWAIDAEKNKCVDSILMLVNGAVVAVADNLNPREDVAIALQNKNLTNSGFFVKHEFISVEKKVEIVLISHEEIIGIINVK
jgi:hypothetical protein